MRTFAAVEQATNLAMQLFEANYITVNYNSIKDCVFSWYNNTDIVDPEILAACALEGKNWFPGATYQQMLNAKEQWFPQNPYEEFSIWEIEAAQYDMIWR